MLNDRLDRLSDYPFTRLANLLADVGPRANREPIIMSIGEPQHPAPPLIASTLNAHAHDWNRYPPIAGTPEFRAAVRDWLNRRYRLPDGLIDPDRSILPLAGTREGLFMTALLAVPAAKAGQRPAVLLPNPFYAVYEGAGIAAVAEPVFLTVTRETGFLPDLDALDPTLLERTALFYLCTPANPQGAVADLAYLKKAIALARRYDFILAVDECYSEIYDRAPPVGALEAAVAMAARDADASGEDRSGDAVLRNLLVFHSLSKRSNAAGLRSGFVAGDPRLVGRFAQLRNYGAAGTPLPALAAAAALWADEAHVEENRALYREKFDAAEAALGGRFGFYRPAGGFFLWLDVGDGEDACRRLWAEGGIRTLPGAYLTRPDPDGVNRGRPYLRVALVHDTATVAMACERIAQIL